MHQAVQTHDAPHSQGKLHNDADISIRVMQSSNCCDAPCSICGVECNYSYLNNKSGHGAAGHLAIDACLLRVFTIQQCCAYVMPAPVNKTSDAKCMYPKNATHTSTLQASEPHSLQCIHPGCIRCGPSGVCFLPGTTRVCSQCGTEGWVPADWPICMRPGTQPCQQQGTLPPTLGTATLYERRDLADGVRQRACSLTGKK